MSGTHEKLVPKKVLLAAGNSHHVTKARVLLCWMLLDFDQKNCCWRTNLGFSACCLQPSERPVSAFFCLAGTGGAVTTGKRSKRDPADWWLSERDGVFCMAARLDCPAARTLLAGTCGSRGEHHMPAATTLPVSTMRPGGCASKHAPCVRVWRA